MLYKHSTPELKALLKGDSGWRLFEADQDSIHLLRIIKGLCRKFNTKQETRTITATDKAIICYVQEGHISNSQYLERFNALVDTTLNYRSSIRHSKALVSSELVKIDSDQENAMAAQEAKALKLAQVSYLSMLMFDGANYYKFKNLKEELRKSWTTTLQKAWTTTQQPKCHSMPPEQ